MLRAESLFYIIIVSFRREAFEESAADMAMCSPHYTWPSASVVCRNSNLSHPIQQRMIDCPQDALTPLLWRTWLSSQEGT